MTYPFGKRAVTGAARIALVAALAPDPVPTLVPETGPGTLPENIKQCPELSGNASQFLSIVSIC